MSFKSTLASKTFNELLGARKLKFVSTDRQIDNGTIALVGKIKKKQVSFKITANGAVLSNEFVARSVAAHDYRRGVQAVSELLTKRFG